VGLKKATAFLDCFFSRSAPLDPFPAESDDDGDGRGAAAGSAVQAVLIPIREGVP